MGVGAVQRGVQAVANFAELRFVLAFDGQLARRDIAGVGISLDVLRFLGLGLARQGLHADDLAQNSLPGGVGLDGFNGVEKRQFPARAGVPIERRALRDLIEAGAVAGVQL